MSTSPDHTEPPTPRQRRRTDWERYAIVPIAVLTSNLSPQAKVAYCYEDAIQGESGEPAEGIRKTANILHIPITTFRNAQKELVEAGLADDIPHHSDGGAESMRTLPILHNPVRKRFNPDVTMPTGKPRKSKPSKHYPGAPTGENPDATSTEPVSTNPDRGGGYESTRGVGTNPDQVAEPVSADPDHTPGLRGSEVGNGTTAHAFGTRLAVVDLPEVFAPAGEAKGMEFEFPPKCRKSVDGETGEVSEIPNTVPEALDAIDATPTVVEPSPPRRQRKPCQICGLVRCGGHE